jgi:hypothetical protein
MQQVRNPKTDRVVDVSFHPSSTYMKAELYNKTLYKVEKLQKRPKKKKAQTEKTERWTVLETRPPRHSRTEWEYFSF